MSESEKVDSSTAEGGAVVAVKEETVKEETIKEETVIEDAGGPANAQVDEKEAGAVMDDEVKMENGVTDEGTAEATVKEEEKSDKAETKPDASVYEAVKDRLEFFLSDANVRQDRFVRNQLMPRDGKSDDVEIPGFISIQSLLKFNTIKKHTTDPQVIVHVVKTMLPEMLKLNETETAVGRVVPFTKDLMEKNVPLSLILKGIPITESKPDGADEKTISKYSVTVDDVRALFEPYGKVTLAKLIYSSHKNGENGGSNKRNKNSRMRYPVGHAVVEFEKTEDLQKAADETLTFKDSETVEPKTPLSIGDPASKLTVMLLTDHIKEKETTKAENKLAGKKHPRDEGEEEADGDDDDDADDAPKGAETKGFTVDWKPGCVIKIEGLPDECDREALLSMLAKAFGSSVDDIKDKKIYVDYSRGQKDGALRFPNVVDEIAKIVQDLGSGDLEVAGTKVTKASLLAGDEEKEYWDKFIEFKNKQIKNKQSKNNNSGKRFSKKFKGRRR